jgi:hypothetical protein
VGIGKSEPGMRRGQMQPCLGQLERTLCGADGVLGQETKTRNTTLLGDQQEGMDYWHGMLRPCVGRGQ